MGTLQLDELEGGNEAVATEMEVETRLAKPDQTGSKGEYFASGTD
jgi:hypothetical protein